MTLETTELADELAPLYDELVESLDEISADERKKDALLVQRDEALEQWKETYRGVASMVDGAFRLVGEYELADRIRPTRERLRGEEAPTDEAPAEVETNGEATDADAETSGDDASPEAETDSPDEAEATAATAETG
jgi:hypothetical protein